MGNFLKSLYKNFMKGDHIGVWSAMTKSRIILINGECRNLVGKLDLTIMQFLKIRKLIFVKNIKLEMVILKISLNLLSFQILFGFMCKRLACICLNLFVINWFYLTN